MMYPSNLSWQTFTQWYKENRKRLLRAKDKEESLMFLTDEIDDFLADYDIRG